MRLCGFAAISFGILAPCFWTFKTYFVRLMIEEKSVGVYDMSIDTIFFLNIFAVILYLAYLAQNPFVLSEFIEGQISGFFFTLGGICGTNALLSGPGGPINALIGT